MCTQRKAVKYGTPKDFKDFKFVLEQLVERTALTRNIAQYQNTVHSLGYI